MTDATRTCTHPGCDLPYNAKGYCNSHYSRWRRGKPMDAPIRRIVIDDKPVLKCERWDCEREARVKGKCRVHYVGDRDYVNPNPCSVLGCERPRDSLGMCNPHAARFRNGKPLDAPLPPKRQRKAARPLCGVLACPLQPGDDGSCEEHRDRSGLEWYRRKMASNGYIQVYVADRRPGASPYGYMAEHRFVMEMNLGRPLTGTENIHHLNGRRDDNRLENLELWAVRQPPGQRVVDLLAWADQINALYGHLRQSGAAA